MISFKNNIFLLSTEKTGYIFGITKFGHLEHIHYGAYIPECDVNPLRIKHLMQRGSSVLYSPEDDSYGLDYLALEWSGTGRGDMRESPLELKLPDGSFCTDFVYESHEIVKGTLPVSALPSAYDDTGRAETLTVTLRERNYELSLKLYYTVFPHENVITRRAELINLGGTVELCKLMSLMLDLPDRGYLLHTFDGAWIKESHRHVRPVEYGITVNSSVTGASSNIHSAGVLLSERGCTEDFGSVYAFDLVYSGNHFTEAEKSSADIVRIQSGINPRNFSWTLCEGESFCTPEAVMSFSNEGFNGVSANLHAFVNEHIVRGAWKNRERPVLINNWEGTFFDFTERKLLSLARDAKRLGVELFVLDDGWFGERNSDKAGLGDYYVNRNKLPDGIEGLCARINRMGMKFGLWFEPESVNPDSDLFRAHPDWAIHPPRGEAKLGRNQLLLDLTRAEVRDYIVESVGKVLDSANIEYVKWDMNRHISDAYSASLGNQGEFYHRYILGLYDILGRIFMPRPKILLESCSSGGNRFDLGMLCYSPQIWTSDDTDPIERLEIQSGRSYLYPQSVMGAHVSASPHQQTLRETPLSTRFNVAAFGVLGYELELRYLSPAQKREVKAQIAFYKKHRRTLQYGTLRRIESHRDNKYNVQVSAPDGHELIRGYFQTLCHAAEGIDLVRFSALEPSAIYSVSTKPQSVYIKRLGGLVKHVLPVPLDPEGFILRTVNKLYALPDGVESFETSGAVLMSGISPNDQFVGTGYSPALHLLGDFGSVLYVAERKKK